jgi:hypothetical protein
LLVAGVKSLPVLERSMSKASWIRNLGLILGVLTVVHYLATGKLPFGTPELLRSGEGSEEIVDE